MRGLARHEDRQKENQDQYEDESTRVKILHREKTPVYSRMLGFGGRQRQHEAEEWKSCNLSERRDIRTVSQVT